MQVGALSSTLPPGELLPPTRNTFLTRLIEVLNAPGGTFDTGVYAFFMGSELYTLATTADEYRIARKLPPSAEKSAKMWALNKDLLLSLFSTASTTSLSLLWMDSVKLSTLTLFGGVLAGFTAFAGRAVISISSLWDSIVELDANTAELYKQTSGSAKEGAVVKKQVHLILKVALYALLSLWGVAGAMFAISAGHGLMPSVDTIFYYMIVVLIGNVIFEIVFNPPKPKKDETSSTTA